MLFFLFMITYFILFVFNIKIKYKKILINQLYNNDNLI